jgi:Ca-activated chloride channel family protein
MTFAWPHLLWLLLVPVAWFAWDLLRARRGDTTSLHPKIVQAEAGRRHVSLARPRAAAGRARPWFCIGLACAVVALARPQWGRIDEPVFDQAREILIAMDLSRSMLTPDVKPSRLGRAKLLTQALLEKLGGERVGLIVFSGTAFLQSPLSSDYEILREFLPALGPDFLPEGGTNYRALIDTALSAFGSTTSADRFLIILSDGEATEENWRERLPELKTKGVRVIALGVGTTAGAMIPDGAGGLVKDERGAVVLSKLESDTLREVASQTGGVYQDASTWIDLASVIQATVDAGRKGKFTEQNTVRLVERFQWPLALALWCLLVSAYYELPVRPKPREVKLRGGEGATPAPAVANGPAIAPMLLFLLAASAALRLAPGALAQSAPPAAPASNAPVLSQIVTRLAAAGQRSARDWSEMAHETVTWGTRLQSGQQPVPEGPVRDALAAVDLGEKLDPKATDWSKLRADLEALLKKPEPPKQDQQKQDQQKQQDQQQKQQDQQNNQQQQQKQDQQKQDQQQPQDSSQQKEQQQGQPKQQPPPQQEKQSAFGDMKDRPPPPPQDTQKVGGVPEKKPEEQPPADPAMAVPLQKLDQLRNQDSPAELFKLMEADKDKAPRKTTKDW